MIWRGWRLRIRRRTRYARHWWQAHELLVRRAGFVALGLILLSVALQLTYPSGKVLPFVRVANQNVGGMSVDAAAKALEQDYKDASVTVKTDSKSFNKTFIQMGANVDVNATAQAAAHYPKALRLVPFSSLFIMFGRNNTPAIQFDNEYVQNFAREVSREGYVAPVNATVSVRKGTAQLIPAKPSKEYPAKAVEAALHAAFYERRTTVLLTPTIKAAPRSNAEVQGILKEAQKAVDMSLTLMLDKEKISISKETVGSWLNFSEDAKTKKLTLSLNGDTVKKYLASVQPKIYKAPGTTKVILMDGKEVSRTSGQNGRGIDMDKTLALLDDAVKKGKNTTVTVPLADIAPQIVYERKYSSAGLSALLASIVSAKGNYAISVREVGGRSASAGGSKQYVAASTYKLYVAYAVIKEVEAGRMSWSGSINGTTVANCFDKMIVISDNACPKAFANQIGWQTIEDEAHALGMSSATKLVPSPYTTANDLALFLYKLQTGNIMSADNQARMLDCMKRQSYTRAGIPAGVGLATADKVGDVDGYKHDAAIVYGNKTYILVIMTSGGSWPGIADAARQVNTFLNS